MLSIKILQGEHKVFPWLQAFITRKLLYVEYKLFFKCNSRSFFLQHTSTLQHVLLLLHGERLIDNYRLDVLRGEKLIIINFFPRVLQHVFSYCSKSVCYSCLRICNIWNWCRKHFVLNIPLIKSSQGGWYPAIVVARVSDHLSQSTCLEMLHPKTECYRCYNKQTT